MPHYAFIVGVNQDWPEQRCSHGDIALARCLSSHCHLPRENLVEVYDDKATRSNILHALESLLNRRNSENRAKNRCSGGYEQKQQEGETETETKAEDSDTLLFYYGGHGNKTGFNTHRHSVDHTNGKIRKEPGLKHEEIVDLLERKFIGGTAWCVIDTCHSGGFGEAVVQRYHHSNSKSKSNSKKSSLNVNYGCLMSVAPDDRAGMEWSMSECFIRAFKGDLICSDGETNCYLSLKNGKHPIERRRRPALLEQSNSNASYNHGDRMENKSGDNNPTPTWEQVIEFLSDEMARIKGDRLTTLFLGEGMENILKKQGTFGDSNSSRTTCQTATSKSNASCIPRDESWMDPFRRKSLAVNDGVYIKWVGDGHSAQHGSSIDGGISPIAQIGWFPGRIVSVSASSNSLDPHCSAESTPDGCGTDTPKKQPTVCIELYDVICKSHWTITLPLVPTAASSPSAKSIILGGLPFGFGFNPQPCVKVITRMARHLAYFDTSVPPNMRVKVFCEGKFYSARTLCRNEIPWEEVDLEEPIEMFGACVPLRWDEDGSISFVSTRHCVLEEVESGKVSKNLKDEKKVLLAEKSARDTAERIKTPMEVMSASLECQGKKLNGGYSPILDTGPVVEEDADFWEAYDAEECAWEPVQLMNKVEPSVLPLKVLAHHMCYGESENFSVVYWESDSTLALVPNSCLRQRRPDTADYDVDEEDVGEVDCGDEAAWYRDVRKYVDEFCYKFDDNRAEGVVKPSKRRLTELGSVAVAFAGLGFIIGSRSRR